MKREDAVKLISKVLKDRENVTIISSTGLISRELFRINDSPQNFYMTGSMGLASSIGLGLAIAHTNRKIIIIEGDGSLLMNMGSLATIGHISPKNLIHIVLDNNSYESSGGECTVSNTANLDSVAKIVGYKNTAKVICEKELEKTLIESLDIDGPTFILVKIEKSDKKDLPRILNLVEIKNRFMKYLSS
ncbi:MAG: thiamine pyrophosphate-dependent enzyme [Candidatus Aenigmatarchaeota archaeon]